MSTKKIGSFTIVVAFISFIGLGLTSGLLGLAWPSMREQFHLPLDGVNVLLLVQTIAYSVASFNIGRLMSRFTSGLTLLVGSAMMVICMFGIALSQVWLMVVGF